MKKLLLGVAAGYSIEDISANLTLASMEGARMVGTRAAREGDEYEFELANGRRRVVLDAARYQPPITGIMR